MALEITRAVVCAVYSRATAGWKTPNEAGAPNVSESVPETTPPTVLGACAVSSSVMRSNCR